MEVKRFNASIGQVPGPVTGQAQQRMHATLADRLQGFADRKNQVADTQAAEEGKRMGAAAAAGTIGGVEIPRDMTIRDQAFASGARAAHAAQIQLDIRGTLTELERANQYDAEGFAKQLEGYQSGLMSEIDESLRPAALNEINDYALRSRVRIEDNIFKKSQAEQLASITESTNGMQDDALSSAYLGDETMLNKKQAQYFEALDHGVASNLLDPQAVAKEKIDFNDNVLIQNVSGTFDRTIQNEGLDAGEKAFEKFITGKHRGLDPVVRDRIESRLSQSLNRERAKARAAETRKNAEVAAREKAIKRDVDNAKFALEKGYQVQGLPDLLDVSRGTKYEDEVRSVAIHQDSVNQFVQLRPSQMDQIIGGMRSKKLNGEEIRLADRLENVRKHIDTELRAGRGLQLAIEQGIVPELPPLGTPASLPARREIASALSEKYETRISPLTPTEEGQLKERLDTASTDDRVTELAFLVDGLGEDVMPLLENVSGKDRGSYAVAGDMLLDGNNASRDVIKGLEVRQAYSKIIPKEFDAEFDTMVSGPYRGMDKQVQIMRDAAKSLYASRSKAAGEVDGEALDSGRLEDVITEITGGILDMRDVDTSLYFDTAYQIEAPARGVTADDMANWMENMTLDQLKTMGNPREPEKLLQAINDRKVTLETRGGGTYYVIRNGVPVSNDDKRASAFVLQWPQ